MAADEQASLVTVPPWAQSLQVVDDHFHPDFLINISSVIDELLILSGIVESIIMANLLESRINISNSDEI